MSKIVKLKIYGPFTLPITRGKVGGRSIEQIAMKTSLQQQFEKQYKGCKLNLKCGCYVFGMRTGGQGQIDGAIIPYYVGKAAAQPLMQEAATADKCNKYTKVLQDHRGTPVLFLVAKEAKGHSNMNATTVDYIEELLIFYAATKRNPRNLINNHHVPDPKKFCVTGVDLLGKMQKAGFPGKEEKSFNKMLGI